MNFIQKTNMKHCILFCNNDMNKTNVSIAKPNSKSKSKSGIIECLPLSISKLKDILIQFDSDKEI